MRALGRLAFFCAVVFALPVSAQLQAYTSIQRQYSTADVTALLGPNVPAAPGRTLLFSADVQAGVKTTQNCGAIGLNMNVGKVGMMVANLPKTLISQGAAILPALPTLAVCYASPSLCAELKNLNFNINEKLKGFSDVCKSMNDYVNKQAIEGSVGSYAKAKAYNACVDNETAGGTDLETAMEDCKDTPPAPLYTNIAKAWLQDNVISQPQNLLASLLEASGQASDAVDFEKYALLSALVGELKLDVNGKVLPIFPAHPLTAQALKDNIKALAIQTACDKVALGSAVAKTLQLSQPSPAARRYEDALYNVIYENMTTEDVKLLFFLDAPDTQLACNAYGRSLSRLALERVTNDSHATLLTALQNPALPVELRDMYYQRESSVFGAFRAYTTQKDERSIPELRSIVAAMARLKYAKDNNTARALSQGMHDLDVYRNLECDDVYTCDMSATGAPQPVPVP
jgi:hypothetical protein